MALTDQPYIPLYVRDWLTNNKLKMCSLHAHGLMINLMCLLHKEDSYGEILLNQKFKQNESNIQNFALMFARMLPFAREEIITALLELVNENVLVIEGDKLICRRMVKDASLSKIRASSGKKGGRKAKKKDDEFCLTKNASKTQAKVQAKPEYENANEYVTAFENEFPCR